MFSRNLVISFVALSFAFLFPAKTLAVQTPSFPLCINPTGNLIASYASGVHGIVGDTNTHTGSDNVYSVNDTQLFQCFCSTDGTAIQTNWLKVGPLSDTQRKLYENDGWIFVPNGSAWGLEDTSYVAKNMLYSCESSSSESTSSSNQASQSFSATSSNVSNVLASTGNIATVYAFFLGGVMMLILGVFLRRKSS